MDDVLDQVAVAFEEDGVNRTVLDELKKVRLKICYVPVALLGCACLVLSSPNTMNGPLCQVHLDRCLSLNWTIFMPQRCGLWARSGRVRGFSGCWGLGGLPVLDSFLKPLLQPACAI